MRQGSFSCASIGEAKLALWRFSVGWVKRLSPLLDLDLGVKRAICTTVEGSIDGNPSELLLHGNRIHFDWERSHSERGEKTMRYG